MANALHHACAGKGEEFLMPCTTKIILDIYGGGGGDDTSGHGCGGRV